MQIIEKSVIKSTIPAVNHPREIDGLTGFDYGPATFAQTSSPGADPSFAQEPLNARCP
jgi:hypothetical protein